jgi:hypothetical protein
MYAESVLARELLRASLIMDEAAATYMYDPRFDQKSEDCGNAAALIGQINSMSAAIYALTRNLSSEAA